MADLLAEIRREALAALRPPEKLALSAWIEQHVRLPSTVAATPGKMRLWPHQKAIADSIGDPAVERVSVLKGVRTGYTSLLVATVAHHAVNDPASVLAVLPAEQDCRNLMTSGIEPVFDASPALRAALTADLGERDTMLVRRFPGGSLRLVSAGAPRNLRGHTCRVLLLDEVDAFEIDVGGEGDPVVLAEKRTLSYADRKIVAGSSPTDETTSRILRCWEASDRRIYEVRCPECHDFAEVTWAAIQWPSDAPEEAAWCCPCCGVLVPESRKPEMVAQGRWRATAPEVANHHGYRVNCLVSLLPGARWGVLAREFTQAKKDGPESLKAFTCTVLAEPWRDLGDEVDDASLASRREPFGLDRIPLEVLVITAGCDIQDDRVEVSTVGWTKDGDALVLAHEVIYGSYLENETWQEVDDMLKRTWKHPNSGYLKVDATVVDSGSGGHVDVVYGFCRFRTGRRVYAGKGVAGFARPGVELSKTKKIRPLILIGVDTIKNEIMNRLLGGRTIRFSDSLTPTYFEQLTSERRAVTYRRGVPTRCFERIPGRRAEAIDCLTYAFAARQLVRLDPDRRAEELSSPTMPKQRSRVTRSRWLSG